MSIQRDILVPASSVPDAIHPELQRVLQYWREKSGERAMPCVDDLDWAEVVRLSDGLCIIDICYLDPSPRRFRYRKVGRDLKKLIGDDIEEQFLDDLYAPDIYAQLFADYERIIDHKQPSYMSILETTPDNSVLLFERILMPLGRENGSPDAFFGAHIATVKGTACLSDMQWPARF